MSVVLTEQELHMLLRATELLNLAVMVTTGPPFPERTANAAQTNIQILRNKIVVAYGRLATINANPAAWANTAPVPADHRGDPGHPVPGQAEGEAPAGPGSESGASEVSR